MNIIKFDRRVITEPGIYSGIPMGKIDMTPEYLREILFYCKDSGFLYWKKRPVCLFDDKKQKATAIANRWNSRHAGKRAFTSKDRHGYHQGHIGNRQYCAHRIIWAIEHGAWPNADIDHINGVRHDNRLINLRVVTRANNLKNMCIPNDNTSGAIGVSWFWRTNKWRAYITENKRQVHLGYFSKFEDAVAARCAANEKFDFHTNHGRPA